ncbi:hypothetical protein BX661DRAFT_175505 [Kickxella alabastrina]|uniref:uncharacterized protein n=1 Tax=Kickxella alabastrina TaxID=61397 RepID=UPI00221E7912|nr:uncharacterized protein BX661DRAFT_175505 [Kickxella alabastrina]KAI7834777.1 hypothetical protein BX661DRAFT_175505 [Kickxella alabastrina]KAJ1947479.1 hypothetical protein GGF37_000419 [Kickxella alabastrina]
MPFTRPDNSGAATLDTGLGDKGKQKRISRRPRGGLKKWLSLKGINAAYQQADENDTCISSGQKKKGKSLVTLAETASAATSVKHTELSAVRFVPARKSGVISTPRENNKVYSLSNRELKSQDVSPALARESNFPAVAMLQTDATAADNSISLADGDALFGAHATKSHPPRRKRSLIYAMYYTAKADDSPKPESVDIEDEIRYLDQQRILSLQQQPSQPPPPPPLVAPLPIHSTAHPWVYGSTSMATMDTISATFMSCTSIPNMLYFPECHESNYMSASEFSCAVDTSIAPSDYPQQHQPVKNTAIEFMLADISEQLSMTRAKINSSADSVRDSEYMSSNGSNSDISCRSSYCEPLSVKMTTYTYSGRFAPRLSTIERVQDGRLLIKPSGDVSIRSNKTLPLAETNSQSKVVVSADPVGFTEDIDSGNESVAKVNPQPEVPIIAMSESITNNVFKLVSVDDFPPVPESVPPQQQQIVSKPNDSMLAHVSRFGVNMAASTHSDLLSELMRGRADSAGPTNNNGLQDASVSSPELPEESHSTIANTSVDTAETTKVDSVMASPVKQDHKRILAVAVAVNSMARNTLLPGFATSEAESERSLVNSTGDKVNSMPNSQVGLLARCLSGRDLGLGGLSNNPLLNNNNRLHSIFSDLSESDMALLDMAHALPAHYYNQFGQLSLLFDGQQHSVVVDDSLTGMPENYVPTTATHASEYNTIGAASAGIDNSNDDNNDDEIMDNLALSDVMAINHAVISPPPSTLQPQLQIQKQMRSEFVDRPLPGQLHSAVPVKFSSVAEPRASSSISARTRKLTTALGRATTPLDGLRHLHRKMKNTSQQRIVPSPTTITTSESSDADAVQQQNQHRDEDGRKQVPKAFRFNELVAVYETWDREEYDRKGMPSAKLDAELIEQIKHELNEFKVYEMQVHEDSRHFTHFIY